MALWYAASTLLPAAVGSCLGSACEATPGRIAISLAIPLLLTSVPVWIEIVGARRSWRDALREIGITRWHRGGFAIALIYLLPLFAFFPIFAAATGNPLSLAPNALGLVAGAILNNGLNEEVMMRGFVFRRLRDERPFWRAAALSTVYFAAYHVPLIATAGPLVGGIGIVIAIPTGLLTALVYERGQRTVWASSLVHAGTNAPAFLFTVGTGQMLATPLYLGTSIVAASAVLVVAAVTGRSAGRARS